MKGGAGKTTVSLGIIAAWTRQGSSIVPFKKGPDYIDAGWLSSAAGQPCYNLDPFLIPKELILSSFWGHYGDADCAVIEGNRGLFDGMDAIGSCSTAELAKTLKAPVILVLDCTKTTRTAAAVLLGMKIFDSGVAIEGVVLNQIAGRRHEQVIREAIAKYCNIPVVGAIPKLRGGQLSERHMGLTPFQEHPGVSAAITMASEIAGKYLDLDAIWGIAQKSGRRGLRPGIGQRAINPRVSRLGVRIGIIRDSAFQFYYPENFEELERRGAELIEVSALTAKGLPEIDALYIGGGFPETHAIALAKNRSFRTSLRKAIEGGLPVYAECGGLMYLGDSLVLDGNKYPMAGIFPLSFSLEKRPQAHGYTVVTVDSANPFYKKGAVLRGHEFHYSKVISLPGKAGPRFAFAMNRGEGIMGRKDGICYKNVLATYTHMHALGAPEWADGMIRQASKQKRGKG